MQKNEDNQKDKLWYLDIPDRVNIEYLLDAKQIRKAGLIIIDYIRSHPDYEVQIQLDSLPQPFPKLTANQKTQLIDIFKAANWTLKEENGGESISLKLKKK